jgi:hypothetical protein
MREAMNDRNDWNALLSLAHGRPVSAAAVIPIGGRPTVARLVAAGYIKRHAVVYLVITEAGCRHLAG